MTEGSKNNQGENQMISSEQTTGYPLETVATLARAHGIRDQASKVGRFILHLLEMVLSMMVGMAVLYLLDVLTPESASYSAVFEYGTIPFDIAMAVFMTVPMVAWMIARGHGRRHSAEMGFAMFAPVVVIVALRLLGAEAYLPGLADASHPVTFLAMILAMLYRRDHYTGAAGHSAHAAHRGSENASHPAHAELHTNVGGTSGSHQLR
jgi:hypothetical protein